MYRHLWAGENSAMVDAILDELQATLAELRAALKELHTWLGEAYEAFLDVLGYWLYRLGCRLQGEEHDPENWERATRQPV
jgi:hypothetical protein